MTPAFHPTSRIRPWWWWWWWWWWWYYYYYYYYYYYHYHQGWTEALRAGPLLPTGGEVPAAPVLLPGRPLADVLAAVRPGEGALAGLLVVLGAPAGVAYDTVSHYML